MIISQTVTLFNIRIKTDTIIVDFQQKLAILSPEFYLHITGMGMTNDIV